MRIIYSDLSLTCCCKSYAVIHICREYYIYLESLFFVVAFIYSVIYKCVYSIWIPVKYDIYFFQGCCLSFVIFIFTTCLVRAVARS